MNLRRDEYVLGIDFGTTNTCAAFMTSREPDPITVPFPNGAHLLKSCVQYGKNADVGDAAYKHLSTGKGGIVRNVKRILGRYYSDEIVQRCKTEKQCAVDIEEVNDKPVLRIDRNTTLAPSDVASRIIQRIYETADKYVKQSYGSDMKCVKVMITFPANFNNNQRTATLLAVEKALEKAGIKKEKLKMMNEPSAAAFHYCKLNRIDNQTILVYDLGGGTFDVSIIHVNRGDYTVLKYAGDPFLGGADFDSLFAKHIEEKCKSDYHVPLIRSNNEKTRRKLQAHLLSLAEEAKIGLSSRDTTYVDLAGFGIESNKKSLDSDSDDSDDDDYSLKVTRSELNNCIRRLIDKSIDLVKQCLSECGLSTSDIDQVVLIGGSSRLTIVEERLKQLFGSWKVSGGEVNPELAVARGACHSLVSNLNLKDRVVYSLGQLLLGGRIQCLIPRQSVIKYTSQEMETFPPKDYTRSISCAIYQGNAEHAGDIERQDDCVLVGRYTIEGYDYAPLTDVHFLTTFTIDEWGIIHVIDKYKEKNKVLVDKMFRWEEPELVRNTVDIELLRLLLLRELLNS